MPEGDTIARAATAMHRALAGQVVTRFVARLAHLARVDDDTPVAGRVIERCVSQGKHLLIGFSGDLMLRTHLRMHGSWHLYRPGERWQRPAHDMRLSIETATWVAVGFNVPDAEFLRAADLPRARGLATLGLDLLAADVDPRAAAARILAAGDRPLGPVLLDQRIVAGLGNVFRSELLFLAGLHPDTRAGSLGLNQATGLIETAIRLLRTNLRPGVITRNTTGRRAPGEALWVYQRTTRPCRRCGTPIRSSAEGLEARRVYWCPACQPAPAG